VGSRYYGFPCFALLVISTVRASQYEVGPAREYCREALLFRSRLRFRLNERIALLAPIENRTYSTTAL
jgi:hypothetical protein